MRNSIGSLLLCAVCIGCGDGRQWTGADGGSLVDAAIDSANKAIDSAMGKDAALGLASLTISDGSFYEFGDVDVNTSVTHVFVVNNKGTADAKNIAASALSGPFSYNSKPFPGGGTCGTSLAADGVCTFIVKFAPTVIGSANTTVTLTYNNGSSSQTVSRAITGAGVTPVEL